MPFVREPGAPELELGNDIRRIEQAKRALGFHHHRIRVLCDGKPDYQDHPAFLRLVKAVAAGNSADDVVRAALRESSV